MCSELRKVVSAVSVAFVVGVVIILTVVVKKGIRKSDSDERHPEIWN